MLKMMMMLLEVLWTRTLPPLDCWTASSRGGILYPRPHQPGEEVTLRRSCYRGQPSSPGGSLATLGAPANTRNTLSVRSLIIIGIGGWLGGAGHAQPEQPITRLHSDHNHQPRTDPLVTGFCVWSGKQLWEEEAPCLQIITWCWSNLSTTKTGTAENGCSSQGRNAIRFRKVEPTL